MALFVICDAAHKCTHATCLHKNQHKHEAVCKVGCIYIRGEEHACVVCKVEDKNGE